MLKILTKLEVEEFTESLYIEDDEYDYHEEFKYFENCKYVGWIVNNQLKCFVQILKTNFTGKLEFLQSINEKIVDVIVNNDDECVKEMFAQLAEKFPNIVIQNNDYMSYYYYEKNYNVLSIENPYNQDPYETEGIYLEEKLLVSKYNTTDFQEKFNESIETQAVESIKYEVMDADELSRVMFNDHMWNQHIAGGNSDFLGFHYFSPKNISSFMGPVNLKFVVCVINNKDIVGVIKFADYTSGDLTYKGLNYIDVHVKYRKQGIAKGLYNKLNEYLSEEDVLISSYLSDMGQMTRIDLTRKKCLTKIKNYDNINEYYESLKTN